MVFIGPVSAGAETKGAAAHYEGRMIDLGADWEGAQACVVDGPDDVWCYRTQADMEEAMDGRADATLARLDSTDTIDAYCINRSDLYLILYENTGFGGRSVSFRDTSTWFDLATYSFDDITSSWKNNTYCDATAATGTAGAGSTLTLTARSSNTDVGATWTDVISSVYISP
ncbi:MAG: hypothetical protein QOK43_324 [Acidimicrobiaceae bacterium]|nr:hypothetical protein [Acidimicrobiaceae bacterium]